MSLPDALVEQLQEAGLDPNDPMVRMMLGKMFAAQRPKPPTKLLSPHECLEGRDEPDPSIAPEGATHYINDRPLHGPFPQHLQSVMFGMGCFWCSEALFYEMDGVWSTQVGYAGGTTKNPTYREVCSGRTNHNEVVRVVFDPSKVSFADLLTVFWETHDPTTPMQQGNDRGTQYRSSIFYSHGSQRRLAVASRAVYAQALAEAGRIPALPAADSAAASSSVSSSSSSSSSSGSLFSVADGAAARDPNHPDSHAGISTEIVPAPKFWMGELHHQQYDARPGGGDYCGLAPLGVKLPRGAWESAGECGDEDS